LTSAAWVSGVGVDVKVLLVLLIIISSVAYAEPGKRASKEERKKARIERRMNRAANPWDKRTTLQKKRDCKALLFLVLSAGLVMQVAMPKE
jgi:hypothetical protein